MGFFWSFILEIHFLKIIFYVYVCGSVSLWSPVHAHAPGDQRRSGLLDMVFTSMFSPTAVCPRSKTHFSSWAVISESFLQLCMSIFLWRFQGFSGIISRKRFSQHWFIYKFPFIPHGPLVQHVSKFLQTVVCFLFFFMIWCDDCLAILLVPGSLVPLHLVNWWSFA